MSYQVFVSKIDSVSPIPGKDRIQIAHVLGHSVIVSKSAKVGDIGVLFAGGGVLNKDFVRCNNLYRDQLKNSDTSQKGYLESDCRVKTIKIGEARSEGLFLPVSSLECLGDPSWKKLKVGDEVSTLNGVDVAWKYVSPQTIAAAQARRGSGKTKRARVSYPDFETHPDTSQFDYFLNLIRPGDLITLTNKVHGTSARFGWTKKIVGVTGIQALINRILRRTIFKDKESIDFVVGTRRVILDSNRDVGFHGSDAFRFDVAYAYKDSMHENEIWYGEIVGYANNKLIMPPHDTRHLNDPAFTKKYGKTISYKYGCSESECRFFLYRITRNGKDLSDAEIRAIASPLMVDVVPLFEQFVFDGDYQKLSKKVVEFSEGDDPIDPSHIREGVVVRVDRDGRAPFFLKKKGFAFRVMEGIADTDAVNLEDMEVVDGIRSA